MAEAAEKRRILVLLETHWDRKQLAACRPEWEERFAPNFPPPDDWACPDDFDPIAFIEQAASGELGPIHGVMSSSDYPGATLAAAVATRLGLPGSRPSAVIGASHKYYSRLIQRGAVPEAVPRFALLDPHRPEDPPPLPFPFFLKPVKGAFSVLARRIDDASALRAFLTSPAVREFTEEYLAIFNRLVAAFTSYEFDGRWFLAEELLSGDLVTVEGYVCDGEVAVLGVVDSILHPNRSFARFEYPSALPNPIQARMADVAARVVRATGLERSLFNIEMAYDRTSDRIAIVEVNPRICGQFSDLYQKVDGTNSYAVALELCSGGHPRPRKRAGRYRFAASIPLRVFEPMAVLEAPDSGQVAAAEARFPETLIWSECRAGDELADFDADEDGASHRVAVINIGADRRAELEPRCAALEALLGYRMRPLAPTAALPKS